MNYGKHKFEVGMTLYSIGSNWWAPQTEPMAIKVTGCELDHVGEMSYFYGDKIKIFPFEINYTIFYDEARAKRHIASNLARKARTDAESKAMDAAYEDNEAEAERIRADYVGKEIMVKDWHTDRSQLGENPKEIKGSIWRKATIKDVLPCYGVRKNGKGNVRLQVNEALNRYNLSNEGKSWRFMTAAEEEAEKKAKEEEEAKAKADAEKQEALAAEAERKAKIEAAEKNVADCKAAYKTALGFLKRDREALKEAEKALEELRK